MSNASQVETLHQTVVDRLSSGQEFDSEDARNQFQDQLKQLKENLDSLTTNQKVDLRDAVAAYSEVQGEALTNTIIETQLNDLEERLAGPAERTGAEWGGRIAGGAGQAVDVVVQESGRVARGAVLSWDAYRGLFTEGKKGLAAAAVVALPLLYLTYRVAKWIKGRPKSSWWSTIFKFTGVSAIAGLGLWWAGGPEEKAQAQQMAQTDQAQTQPAQPAVTASTTPAQATTGTQTPQTATAAPSGAPTAIPNIAEIPENEELGTKPFEIAGRTVQFLKDKGVRIGQKDYKFKGKAKDGWVFWTLYPGVVMRKGSELVVSLMKLGEEKAELNLPISELAGVISALESTGKYEKSDPVKGTIRISQA